VRREVGDQVLDAVRGLVPVCDIRRYREILSPAHGGDETTKTVGCVDDLKFGEATVIVIVGIKLVRVFS